jgi:hypothetical protein
LVWRATSVITSMASGDTSIWLCSLGVGKLSDPSSETGPLVKRMGAGRLTSELSD